MKRVLYLVLTVACALLVGAGNVEGGVEELREEVRLEGVERGVPHGMSGVDVVVSVANQTRHKITLEEAELTLKYDRRKVLMLQLRDVVELPKRFEGELEISTRMKVYDPLSAIVVLNRVRNKSFDEMSVTIDAKVKVGPVRKNIFVADMDLPKFLSKFALSTEEVDRI